MIDKFAQAYQEEAREVLQDLESSLLALVDNSDNSELVDRAFRDLHTIKGSGAMFGFDSIAAFTHDIETAFDCVRNGTLPASADLVSLTLKAVDQIRAMLDEAAGHGRADASTAAQILAQLRALTGAGETAEPKPLKGERQANPSPEAEEAQEWRIRFSPAPDFMMNGSDPLLLLDELGKLGSLQVKADTSKIPALEEIDPVRCYVSWELRLTTAASLDELKDVFIFVEDKCELAFEPVSGSSSVETDLAELKVDAGRQSGEGESRASERPSVPAASEVERGKGDRRESSHSEAASSIRVPAAKLDSLVDLVGRLVTVQARLSQIAARYEDQDIQAVAEEVEGLTSELRDNSMSLRTLPLRPIFERFRRLVYDLGRSLHKDVELTFEGEETNLDKTVIDQLGDPMMHLIRNSMDHGIETPEARVAAGKSSTARIHLSARHVGAQVHISVSDDGKGIDRDAVRERAIDRGLIASDTRLGDAEIFSLILSPGFSTAREVTDLSGRGVGMDVVRRNVEALRGSVEIASQHGLGTTVTLRLPLTLAIIDGLLVRVGQSQFVMPLANTVECVELSRRDIEDAGGKHLANIRGEIVPYVRLSEYMRMRIKRPELEQVMIAETDRGRFGFVVDQVLGHHQTVIKNLGRLFKPAQFLSGATILGDGTLALILDLDRLAQDALKKSATDNIQRVSIQDATDEIEKETALKV